MRTELHLTIESSADCSNDLLGFCFCHLAKTAFFDPLECPVPASLPKILLSYSVGVRLMTFTVFVPIRCYFFSFEELAFLDFGGLAGSWAHICDSFQSMSSGPLEFQVASQERERIPSIGRPGIGSKRFVLYFSIKIFRSDPESLRNRLL